MQNASRIDVHIPGANEEFVRIGNKVRILSESVGANTRAESRRLSHFVSCDESKLLLQQTL
jgi:hypothetical protein